MKKTFAKSLFSTLLALLFCAVYFGTVLSVGVYAQPWNGEDMDTKFASGNGTEATPYVVKTPAQLFYLAMTVSVGESYIGQYIVLDANIDLGGKPWIPIGGGVSTAFKGTFDGKGHTISNLNVEGSGSNPRLGLFGTTVSATIKNLNLVGASVTASSATPWLGAFVGNLQGSTLSACTLDETSIVKSTYAASTGGLVGRAVGNDTDGPSVIEYCTNRGTVENSGIKGLFVGGIAGFITNGSSVKNCANYGTITSSGDEGEKNSNSGGIVGLVGSPNTSITDCYNAGKIISTSNAGNAGGIVGKTNSDDGATLKNCLNISTEISATNKGTIIGYKSHENLPTTDCFTVNLPGVSASGKTDKGSEPTATVIDSAAMATRKATIDSAIAAKTVTAPEPVDTDPVVTTGAPDTTDTPGTTTAPATSDSSIAIFAIAAVAAAMFVSFVLATQRKKRRHFNS